MPLFTRREIISDIVFYEASQTAASVVRGYLTRIISRLLTELVRDNEMFSRQLGYYRAAKWKFIEGIASASSRTT